MSAPTRGRVRSKALARDLPHTRGPYHSDGHYVMANADPKLGEPGEAIAHAVGANRMSNARRIAACLGAFRDLSTPALETLARWGWMDAVRLRGASGDDQAAADRDAIAYILLNVRIALAKGDMYRAQIYAENAVQEIRQQREKAASNA